MKSKLRGSALAVAAILLVFVLSAPGNAAAELGGQGLVRMIIFDHSDEGFVPLEANNTYHDSWETFKMTLYEVSPDVFEGEMSSDYYEASDYVVLYYSENSQPSLYEQASFMRSRTRNIRFTPGAEISGRVLFAAESIETNYSSCFDEGNRLVRSAALKSRTKYNYYANYSDFTYRLEIDGDTAKLFIPDEYDPVYVGVCVMAPLPGETHYLDLYALADKAIFINTVGRIPVYSMPGNQETPDLYEYSGVLTAAPTVTGKYIGNLFVYGDGSGVPFCDEDISFTLQPFSEQAYREAGGILPIGADAMGVISTSAGGYIIWLDGDIAMLEAVGSGGVTFIGRLIPESGLSEARRIADDTKPVARGFYDGVGDKAVENSQNMDGVPRWYLPWLMPVPIHPTEWHYLTHAQGQNFFFIDYIDTIRDPKLILSGECDSAADFVTAEYRAQLEGAVDDLFSGYDARAHRGPSGMVRYNKGAYGVEIEIIDIPVGDPGCIVEIAITRKPLWPLIHPDLQKALEGARPQGEEEARLNAERARAG